jgi:acyl-CoA reductase-like NAD-dependent aldehyde dehydrogenase
VELFLAHKSPSLSLRSSLLDRIDWSANVDRRLRTINVGTIRINSWTTACEDAEESGYKQSRLGRSSGLSARAGFDHPRN